MRLRLFPRPQMKNSAALSIARESHYSQPFSERPLKLQPILRLHLPRQMPMRVFVLPTVNLRRNPDLLDPRGSFTQRTALNRRFHMRRPNPPLSHQAICLQTTLQSR